MKKTQQIEGRICPNCGDKSKQINSGKNRTGSQRCLCKVCNCRYTFAPKQHAYPESVRLLAIEEYSKGGSGRSIGKAYGFSHQNVLRWIRMSAKNKHESD